MLSTLAAAGSRTFPELLASQAADRVILGTFLAAALLFAVFAVIHAIRKPRQAAPSLPLPDAGEAPAAPSPEGPPPLPSPDPYVPPWSLSAAPLEPATGPARIFQYFKVPTHPYRWIDLLFIGLVFLIFSGLTAGSGGADAKQMSIEEKFRPEILVTSMFFQFAIMGIACAFMTRRIPQAEWLGLRWRQWWLAFIIAPATVFFMWISMAVLQVSGWNGWLEQALGIESLQESVKLLQEAKDPVVVALMAIAAVIVAPIAEEVVFRGYLYPAAKHFCGPVGGILFSSLVFAAAHGNVVAIAPLFLLAVLLCLIYEFTGSIWANISVHFLFNAATVAIQLLFRYGVLDMPSS
jgi:membrane protease YdiL (CAAX protease family)